MIAAFGILILSGCAHLFPQKKINDEPRKILNQICSIGTEVKKVSGSVWIQAHTNEMTGSFSASLAVARGKSFRMEVTNPFAGAEAVILKYNDKYYVQIPEKGPKARRLDQNGLWGGIPVQKAESLFLGMFPCPSPEEIGQVELKDFHLLVWGLSEQQKLKKEPEMYNYDLNNQVASMYWPQNVIWNHHEAGKIEFEFLAHEVETLSPVQWKIKSMLGKLNVRWQNRDLEEKIK